MFLFFKIKVEANEAKASARESQRLLAKVKEELSLVEKDGKEMETEISHWRAKYQTLKSTLQSKVSHCCKTLTVFYIHKLTKAKLIAEFCRGPKRH